MKRIRDFIVPLYGPGSMVILVPSSGEIKSLGIDDNTADWFVALECTDGESLSRPIEIKMTDYDGSAEGSYEWVGGIVLNGIKYSVWWREFDGG